MKLKQETRAGNTFYSLLAQEIKRYMPCMSHGPYDMVILQANYLKMFVYKSMASHFE